MNPVISANPHVKTPRTTKRIMIDVCIALIPAAVMGCVYFGLSAFLTLLIAVAGAILTEWIYSLVLFPALRNPKQFWRSFDFTSVVTGLLLVLSLPANLPWYMPLLGSVFAIAVVKMLFGGTGHNIVNPAMAGRVFLFMSFTAVTACNIPCNIGPLFGQEGALSTGATQLWNLLNGLETLTLPDLFLGTGVAGCIGETCKAAILLGGVYLVARKVICWWFPVLYLAAAGLCTVLLNDVNFALFLPALFSGGLMLGAVFMATDYVTSPKSKLGNAVYFLFLGILTAVLRQATGIEVVSFCILIGNVVTPLIDLIVPTRPFGYRKRNRKEVKA